MAILKQSNCIHTRNAPTSSTAQNVTPSTLPMPPILPRSIWQKCKQLFIVGIIILSLYFCCIPGAQAKLYHFELIIVSHISEKNFNECSKLWQYPTSSSADAPLTIPLLTLSPHLLNNEQAALNKSKRYHTLLHLAWQQPIFPGTTYAIPLSKENHEFNDITQENQEEAENLYKLQGVIRIHLERYLEVSLNLMLGIPTHQIERMRMTHFSNYSNEWVYFPLSQTRRMRSNELNYIDSPLYGVLIKIIPLDDKKYFE